MFDLRSFSCYTFSHPCISHAVVSGTVSQSVSPTLARGPSTRLWPPATSETNPLMFHRQPRLPGASAEPIHLAPSPDGVPLLSSLSQGEVASSPHRRRGHKAGCSLPRSPPPGPHVLLFSSSHLLAPSRWPPPLPRTSTPLFLGTEKPPNRLLCLGWARIPCRYVLHIVIREIVQGTQRSCGSPAKTSSVILQSLPEPCPPAG